MKNNNIMKKIEKLKEKYEFALYMQNGYYAALYKVNDKDHIDLYLEDDYINTYTDFDEALKFLIKIKRDLISKKTKEGIEKAKASGKKFGHGKKFLKSKYDDYEREIFDFRSEHNLSFSKICSLLDKNKTKNFKAQSMGKWFNSRYEFRQLTSTYEKNYEYAEYCKKRVKNV